MCGIILLGYTKLLLRSRQLRLLDADLILHVIELSVVFKFKVMDHLVCFCKLTF
jgi:hypothetical protein